MRGFNTNNHFSTERREAEGRVSDLGGTAGRRMPGESLVRRYRAPLRWWLLAAVLAVLASAGCAATSTSEPPDSRPAPSSAPSPTSPTGTLTPSTTVAEAGFASSVAAIDEAAAARMSASWRPGCPVALDALRLITLTHWGFDGDVHRGELVVHADDADAVVAVFEALFEQRFPIEQVRLVDEFGGDDDRSMAANNTSAFNCRPVTGSQRWSEHAFGRAIDINPVQNPFVTRSGAVLPPEGAAHTRRDPAVPGLITADGPVVAAFRAVGWEWGGDWSSGKDYQHFSATGR